ncbi:MAG: tripartite tricarboxylate transporter TctB family protein [Pseudolabrys sp.]|nr:tripartite tricarboxylate transporter TctB family protein [Pseudolabrys sp.]MDP2293893.1 tripartite tricarboxylate transporter TctB family protein [Pseudolabrys sp.]
MAHRIQGLLFILIGVVSLIDSWRINKWVRPGGFFDGIGPDGYLGVISVILILLGIALAIRSKIGGETSDWNDLGRWPPADYVVVTAILALFVLAIPILGFSFSCFLFFIALYGLLGDWSWGRTVAYSFVTAASIYVIFEYLAEMSLPKSFLGV